MQMPQPVASQSDDTTIEMPISPTITGFSTAGNWPNASTGMVSECDGDLAFWTSLAGWDDPRLTLPAIELGTPLPTSIFYQSQ